MTRIPQEAARGKLGAWRGGKERLGDQGLPFHPDLLPLSLPRNSSLIKLVRETPSASKTS